MQEKHCADTYSGLLCARIRRMFLNVPIRSGGLQEVRMRIGKPLLICYEGKEWTFTQDGELTNQAEEGYLVTEADVKETLEHVTGYSLYAFDEELRQGFLTVAGGHRIGVAGKIVYDRGKILCIRNVSCLNIRMSHQKIGCATWLLPYVVEHGEPCHTLILSPPGGGKTTLLRDLIRQLSNGTKEAAGKNIGVVDERSELAGSWNGVAQNDLGMRTDVLDCCPKAEGMMILLRAMAPQIIAVDELGSESDGYAVQSVFHCGCKLLATAHGNSLEDIRRSPLLREMVQNQMFERYILLGDRQNPGRVRKILDGEGAELLKEGDGRAWTCGFG